MKENREKLIEFVKLQHGSQVRKYTNEPYFNHIYAVALASEKYGVSCGFEIGLCHDLLEDTKCNDVTLYCFLHDTYKLPLETCDFIVTRVKELTDKFTTESYPYLNRKIRKECEALRLHTISREAQIVKAFDLIDNTSSIIQHDKGFAQKYIPEKRAILIGFKKLPTDIKSQVWNCLLDAEQQLLNL